MYVSPQVTVQLELVHNSLKPMQKYRQYRKAAAIGTFHDTIRYDVISFKARQLGQLTTCRKIRPSFIGRHPRYDIA